jgi:hypothetical protein
LAGESKSRRPTGRALCSTPASSDGGNACVAGTQGVARGERDLQGALYWGAGAGAGRDSGTPWKGNDDRH